MTIFFRKVGGLGNVHETATVTPQMRRLIHLLWKPKVMPFVLWILNFARKVILNHVCNYTITEKAIWNFWREIFNNDPWIRRVGFLLTKLCLTKDIMILVFSFRIYVQIRLRSFPAYRAFSETNVSNDTWQTCYHVWNCLSISSQKTHLNKHDFGSAKYYLHMDNFSFFIMRCLTMRKKCKMLA